MSNLQNLESRKLVIQVIRSCQQLIKLLDVSTTYDETGIAHQKEKVAYAYAELSSIGQKEYWSGAGTHDVKPETKAVVFSYDYNGEKFCEISGERYEIYRSFFEGDRVSLYLQRGNREHVK